MKNELYLASPKDFNDPFDCRIAENYFLLGSDEDVIDKFIDRVYHAREDYIKENNINPELSKKNLKERLRDRSRFQGEAESGHFDMQDKHYGIIPLTGRWNSILMWSHYAANHSGFCVGYHESKLRNSGLFGKGGNVNYDINFPKIEPEPEMTPESVMEVAFIETHTKSEDWKYEQEYRLVKNYFPEEPDVSERIVIVPSDSIAEVIVGISIKTEDRSEIQKVCQSKNIPLYQARKVPFRFEITRERIT